MLAEARLVLMSEGRIPQHELDDQEDLTAGLEEAIDLLRSWAFSEHSDSVRRQELRRREYSNACRTLEKIYQQAYLRGLYIRLNIPEESEEIRTKRLGRNAYDLIEISTGESLKPGESFLLKRKT